MDGKHHSPNAPILVSFPNADAIVESLAAFIIKAQKESIDKKGRFTVALSGGSLPKMLRGLIENPAVKWDKWLVFISPFILIMFLMNAQASVLCRRTRCAAGSPRF
jgi:6-phosphogluconolactonase